MPCDVIHNILIESGLPYGRHKSAASQTSERARVCYVYIIILVYVYDVPRSARRLDGGSYNEHVSFAPCNYHSYYNTRQQTVEGIGGKNKKPNPTNVYFLHRRK